MNNATKYTDRAVNAGKDRPAVLEKRWVVAQAEGTSSNLDKVVEHRSESDPSKLSNSPSSPLVSDSNVVENIYRAVLDNYANLIEEMLQTIDYAPSTSDVESTDSSTPTVEYHSSDVEAQLVKNEIERLFALATFIELEPGMTNDFQEGLEEAVIRYGELALLATEDLILNEKVRSAIAMEALQYIGGSDVLAWRDERRKMLERCLLASRSAWVRDGAGLGLASLDDPSSIPTLEEAILNEPSQSLRSDLTLVLQQLEHTLTEF